MKKKKKFPITSSEFLVREICKKMDCHLRYDYGSNSFNVKTNEEGILKCCYFLEKTKKWHCHSCIFEISEKYIPSTFKLIFQSTLFQELKKKAIKKWKR